MNETRGSVLTKSALAALIAVIGAKRARRARGERCERDASPCPHHAAGASEGRPSEPPPA